jgi:hypothetical protein
MSAGRTLRATGPTPHEGGKMKTRYLQPSGSDTHRHLATLQLDFPTVWLRASRGCDKQPLLHSVVLTTTASYGCCDNYCFLRVLWQTTTASCGCCDKQPLLLRVVVTTTAYGCCDKQPLLLRVVVTYNHCFLRLLWQTTTTSCGCCDKQPLLLAVVVLGNMKIQKRENAII